jgi:hypothetical protein
MRQGVRQKFLAKGGIMNLGSLIVPLGAISYLSMLLAVLSAIALMKFNVPWISWTWHKWFGFTAVVTGTLHLAVVLFLNS